MKFWEVATARCVKTLHVGGVVKDIAWNPNVTLSLVAAIVYVSLGLHLVYIVDLISVKIKIKLNLLLTAIILIACSVMFLGQLTTILQA